MVTDGETIQDAIVHAEDAIATMISDDVEYPEVQDPSNWELEDNQRIMWVSVNMTKWLNDYGKTVRKNITISEGLNNWAKENNINVSRVATKVLKQLAGI